MFFGIHHPRTRLYSDVCGRDGISLDHLRFTCHDRHDLTASVSFHNHSLSFSFFFLPTFIFGHEERMSHARQLILGHDIPLSESSNAPKTRTALLSLAKLERPDRLSVSDKQLDLTNLFFPPDPIGHGIMFLPAANIIVRPCVPRYLL